MSHSIRQASAVTVGCMEEGHITQPDGTKTDRTRRRGELGSAQTPVHLQPQNVTLGGHGGSVDETRSRWIKSKDRCIFKRKGRNYHRHRGDSHVHTKAEITEICPHAKGRLGAPRSWGRAGGGLSLCASKGMNPASTVSLDFGPQSSETMSVLF